MEEMMEKVAKVGSVYGIMQEMMLQGLLQGTLTECFFYIMKKCKFCNQTTNRRKIFLINFHDVQEPKSIGNNASTSWWR